MKKFLLIAFVVALATNTFAQSADISGAVGFTEPVEEKQTVSEQKTLPSEMLPGELPKADVKEVLSKAIKKAPAMDNPRIAKKAYAQLKEMQASIKQAQQEKLNEKTYPTEQAKEEALKEIEGKALVRFEDYQEEEEELRKKFNEDPHKSLLDMSSRMFFSLDHDEDHLENVQNQLKEDFEELNGMSMEEYQKAFEEQTEIELQQMQEEKAESFPVLKTDKDVTIEKVDDQNALLHVSVGAPRSKKE